MSLRRASLVSSGPGTPAFRLADRNNLFSEELPATVYCLTSVEPILTSGILLPFCGTGLQCRKHPACDVAAVLQSLNLLPTFRPFWGGGVVKVLFISTFSPLIFIHRLCPHVGVCLLPSVICQTLLRTWCLFTQTSLVFPEIWSDRSRSISKEKINTGAVLQKIQQNCELLQKWLLRELFMTRLP